jgi:integrase
MSNTTKTGRKQKHFVDPATGKPVVGLSRMTDGRWRIIGSQTRFREPDVQKAIAKFRQLTSSHDPDKLALASIDRQMHPYARKDHPIWRYFAQQIADKPQWVAEATGIEWIGYGPTLKPPEKVPAFKELEDNYEKHNKVQRQQKNTVLRDWRDFVKTTAISNISNITAQTAIAYRDAVYARNLSGKRQLHLFNNTKHLLRFNLKRAVAVEYCTRALAALSCLEASEESVTLEPKPIKVADWKKLLQAAKGDDLAMCLLMLNCAMYAQEAVNLKWEHINADNQLIARRKKKGRMLRLAVLWPETIEALKAVQRKGDHIFYSYAGSPLTISGAAKRFRKLRKLAGVPHVEANQLRDGAATAAAKAKISGDVHAMLMGHRIGIKDHYALRDVEQVAPACEAIRLYYMT